MPQAQCSIRHQSSRMTAPLRLFVVDYGDYLEVLSACEKLHLLSILTLWQARDTELSNESGYDQMYTLAEAIADYPFDLGGGILGSLKCLEGIEVDQILDLMVAITNQIRDGIYQS